MTNQGCTYRFYYTGTLAIGSRPMTKHGCTYQLMSVRSRKPQFQTYGKPWMYMSRCYSSSVKTAFQTYDKTQMYMSVFGLGYLESSKVFFISSLNTVVTVPPQPYGRGFFYFKSYSLLIHSAFSSYYSLIVLTLFCMFVTIRIFLYLV